jgi:hypothetical protein
MQGFGSVILFRIYAGPGSLPDPQHPILTAPSGAVKEKALRKRPFGVPKGRERPYASAEGSKDPRRKGSSLPLRAAPLRGCSKTLKVRGDHPLSFGKGGRTPSVKNGRRSQEKDVSGCPGPADHQTLPGPLPTLPRKGWGGDNTGEGDRMPRSGLLLREEPQTGTSLPRGLPSQRKPRLRPGDPLPLGIRPRP